MPNKNYQRGRRFEWEVKKDLESQGWIVVRTAGSHGLWDIIAFRDIGGEIRARLIQCKVVQLKGSGAQIERLKKEFKANKVFPHYKGQFNQLLAVKIAGTKQYETYSLGELT